MKHKEQMYDVLALDAKRRMYDGAVKILLRNRQVLSVLLQGCVREFRDVPIESILEQCLVDFSTSCTMHCHSRHVKSAEEVFMAETGISDLSGRKGEMDLCFYVREPMGLNLPSWQLVDVEFQNRENPGYDLMKRASYYVASMIYMQYGRNFAKSDYNMLWKSTSIWLCPCKGDSQAWRYRMSGERLVGDASIEVEDCDVMRIVKIRFNPNGERHPSPMIGMLQTLFSSTLSLEEKIRCLKDRYGITIEKTQEMEEMIDLSEYYIEYGYEKGAAAGREEGRQEGRQEGRVEGREEGREENRHEMKERFISLLQGMMDKLARISSAVTLVNAEAVSLEELAGIMSEDDYAAVVRQLGN